MFIFPYVSDFEVLISSQLPFFFFFLINRYCLCMCVWMLEEMEKRSLWHIEVLNILLAFQKIISSMESNWDFPGALVVELPANAGDAKDMVFDSWARKIPWNRKWATHSSILAWKIPWTVDSGGLQSTTSQELDMTERLSTGEQYLDAQTLASIRISQGGCSNADCWTIPLEFLM